MTVKPGDTVRYLNSVGGGRVVRIDDKLAYVDEDGFETPVLLRECVVVASADSTAPASKTREKASAPAASKYTPPIVRPNDAPVELPVIETPGGDVINLALGYEPQNIRQLSHTAFDTYIVNDSNYYLYLTYLTRASDDELWTLRFDGLVEPNMQVLLCETQIEDLPLMDRVCVQYMAFKRGREFKTVRPASVEVKLDTTKFARLHCFKPHTYFENPAIVLDLVSDGVVARQNVPDPASIEKAMLEKGRLDRKPVKKTSVAPHRPEIIEVDLHADELIDSTAGLSNSEILNMQIDKFCEVMNANHRNPGQKIVFIHGKGEGVLRQAIMKELTHRYKGHDVQDASFREYGFGATQVTIRANAGAQQSQSRPQGKRHK